MIVKLAESPFYATGGGQVADGGTIECEDGDCRAQVVDVLRLGDDQAVVVEPIAGELKPGERVVARVDRRARHATAANHTATHLLHAALRARLGSHVRQAGSYVGPDKLRFDFTHGPRADRRGRPRGRGPGQRVDHRQRPVRPIVTTLDEAKALGATALFGEKYGDIVRMVEIGDGSWSRELCGGTHVRSTAEIGLLKVTARDRARRTCAASRRSRAGGGRAARTHDALLHEAARALRTQPDRVPEAIEALQQRAKQAAKASAAAAWTWPSSPRAARRWTAPASSSSRSEIERRRRRSSTRRTDQGPARRAGRGRARHDGRRARAPRRGGDARAGVARREGGGRREGRRGRRRRWRRRARHDRPGRRPRARRSCPRRSTPRAPRSRRPSA